MRRTRGERVLFRLLAAAARAEAVLLAGRVFAGPVLAELAAGLLDAADDLGFADVFAGDLGFAG